MGIIYLSKQNLVCDNNPVVIVKKCRALNDSVKLFSSFSYQQFSSRRTQKMQSKKKKTHLKKISILLSAMQKQQQQQNKTKCVSVYISVTLHI
jgi:hypothetical protein